MQLRTKNFEINIICSNLLLFVYKIQFVNSKYTKSQLIKLITQNIFEEILKYNNL